MFNEREIRHGLSLAIVAYPLIDHALRNRLGLSVEERRLATTGLMSRFSQVAASQPNYAWFPEERSLEALRVSPQNRMAGHPYTKLECAFPDVDQAAAVL